MNPPSSPEQAEQAESWNVSHGEGQREFITATATLSPTPARSVRRGSFFEKMSLL
jgi:hypothetical protein